ILAIAAARAGAAGVIATDINPNAAQSVPENAGLNGVGGRVSAVCMDLLSGLAATPSFDVIVANLPKHTQVPRDVADRRWTGGAGSSRHNASVRAGLCAFEAERAIIRHAVLTLQSQRDRECDQARWLQTSHSEKLSDIHRCVRAVRMQQVGRILRFLRALSAF